MINPIQRKTPYKTFLLLDPNKLFIFTQYFTPAKKAGGPITSISNLVKSMDMDFKIIARGQDLNENEDLEGIQINNWIEEHNYFIGRGFRSIRTYFKLLKAEKKEAFYVNGIFDWKMNLLPILIGEKVIISPRGMLQKGALSNGSLKKGLYLAILHYSLKSKSVKWHATDEVEAKDIQTIFGKNEKIEIISNIPNFFDTNKVYKKDKSKKEIKLVYYSLISKKKQLDKILLSMDESKVPITLDIYGPIKDEQYWQECMELVNKSDRLKCSVTYKGHISVDLLPSILPSYDFFILLTLGENFGHAIFEALNCHLPIIISSKTPWQLKENEEFGFVIDSIPTEEFWNEILALSQEEYLTMTKHARNASEEFYMKVENELIPNYKKMFESHA
jgi:glycosyltransferase involved in cell wall biosynthesis